MRISLDLLVKPVSFVFNCLSIRGGQVLGSRSYFPSVPAHSAADEIITAFLTQHYLNRSVTY